MIFVFLNYLTLKFPNIIFLNKRLKTDITNAFNTSLSELGLAAFEHRFLRTASLFIHKIVNISTSQQLLAKQIVFKKDQKNNNSLRNSENVCIPPTKTLIGEESFSYFFSSLLNNVYYLEYK